MEEFLKSKEKSKNKLDRKNQSAIQNTPYMTNGGEENLADRVSLLEGRVICKYLLMQILKKPLLN